MFNGLIYLLTNKISHCIGQIRHSMKVKELADMWIEYHHTDDDDLFQAVTKLERMIESDEERAWRVILTILKKDNSAAIMANLAAGPMEDILVQHGDVLMERVQAKFEKDPDFKKVITDVWQSGMPEDVWLKIVALKESV